MAGAMRKMSVYLGLVEDHGDDGYDEYDEYEAARKGSRESRTPPRGYEDRYEPGYDDRYTSRSVRPIPDTRAVRTFRSDAVPPSRPTQGVLIAGNRRHPDRDARLLEWRRQELHIVERVVDPLMGERLTRPQTRHDLQPLVQHRREDAAVCGAT